MCCQAFFFSSELVETHMHMQHVDYVGASQCRRFPKASFFHRRNCITLDFRDSSACFFPCMVLSLQVGLLFIAGFASNGIKLCAFAAVCFDTFARDCRSARCSHHLVCERGAGEENTRTRVMALCVLQCKLWTRSSTMYFKLNIAWSSFKSVEFTGHLVEQ